MGTVSDWLLWIAGALVGVAGVVTILWALLADRSRGRRRCPKCWYDLGGVPGGAGPGAACPECGRSVVSTRELLRTRRHWKLWSLGLALAIAGVCASLFPYVQSGRWMTSAPTTVLILALPFCDDTKVANELMQRGNNSDDYVSAASRRGIWGWQRWLLARSAPAAAGREGLSLRVRRNALCMIATMDLDPRPSVETMLHWLGSSNKSMIQQAVLELKCVLHRLGPDLDRCLTAINAHAGTTDTFARWDVGICALFGEQARGRGPWPEPRLPADDQDPATFVERLRGNMRSSLLDGYEPLGLSVNYFTRPFTRDPGPFRVDRHNLDLDGDGHTDCVLRVGDSAGYYWNVLVFLRRGPSWTLVDLLRAATGNISPPEPSCIDAGSAGRFLVVRTTAGNGYGYELLTDVWLKVSRDGCRAALSAWSEGHVDRLWDRIDGSPNGAAELRTSVRAAGPDEQAWVEYQVDAGFSDTTLSTVYRSGQPRSIGGGAGEISLRGKVRYVWDSANHRFVLDPLASDWTAQEVEGVCTDGPREFLEHHAARLAGLTLDDRSRTWLRAVIKYCGDTPGARVLKAAIEGSETDGAAKKPDSN